MGAITGKEQFTSIKNSSFSCTPQPSLSSSRESDYHTQATGYGSNFPGVSLNRLELQALKNKSFFETVFHVSQADLKLTYVAQNDLEFLPVPPLPMLALQDCTMTSSVVLWLEPRAQCMLGKPSTNLATVCLQHLQSHQNVKNKTYLRKEGMYPVMMLEFWLNAL